MRQSGSLQTRHTKENSMEMFSATASRRKRSRLRTSTQNSVKGNVKSQKDGVSPSVPVQYDASPIDPLQDVVDNHNTTDNYTNACQSLNKVPKESCRPIVEIATSEGLLYVYKSFEEGMSVFPHYPEQGIPVQGMAALTQYPGQGMTLYPQYRELAYLPQYPGYYVGTQDAPGPHFWPGLRHDSSRTQ